MTQNFEEMTFLEYCHYYWGESSDVTGELPLCWYDRYQPIGEELDSYEAIGN